MPRIALIALSVLLACQAVPRVQDLGVSAEDGGRAGPGDAGRYDDAGLLAPDGGSQLSPDPQCEADGCLREATFVTRVSRATLQTLVDPRVRIENGYEVWTLTYATGTWTALATVTLPLGRAPDGGFPIVENNHGTTGVGDPCAWTGTALGTGLAGLFGARRAVGVAPDPPGLGTPGLHPYLVAEVAGRGALDGLRAARQLARWQGVPLAERYAMVGLSQGGHTTLAAAARHRSYAPELDLRAFGVTAPASLFEEQWRVGVTFDGPHLVFHALVVHAWSDHDGWSGPSPWTAALAPLVDEGFATRCLVAAPGRESLSDLLGSTRSDIFAPTLLDEYVSGRWSRFAAFRDGFAANRIRPYSQTAPLRVYQGTADTTIPEADTRALVDELREGGVVVDYEVVAGGGHLDVAFGFLASRELRTDEAIAWVRDALGTD
ncbi:MAG: lipase family protein [Sandaracinaceae bacterium]